MRTNENNSMPYMKSLAVCLNKMMKEGYTDDFRITEKGLESVRKHHNYRPDQIQIVNFFRFEGQSDPDDNAILYVIETDDGSRGILIDAYGVYNDPNVSKFIKAVETVQRKNLKN
jgi:hypothetical protein